MKLAVRVLKWVRQNRGEATWDLNTGIVPEWLSDALDNWVSDDSHSGYDHFDGGHHGGSAGDHSGGGHHSDSGGDHS